MQLGDRRSSRLLLEMRSKAGARINDNLLKSLFLQRLPTNVQQILAISNDNLDMLAEMADGIMPTSSAPMVNAVAASADQPDLRTMLCQITSLLEARTRDQSRSRNQRRSPSRSRQTENPEHCWYHGKFKQRATKCRPPMFLPDGKLLVPSSRKRGDGEAMIQLLYLTDKTSSLRYLIDTRADVSVVSHSAHKTSCADAIICCEWNNDPNVWINIATIETPSHIDFQEMANSQNSDKELSEILAHPDKSSLVLQPFPMGDHAIELYCDVASNRIRPFVPEVDRKKVFSSLHSISHPGIKATVKLVEERYL
ncbi:uncharacterized protein CDAR_515171 [Caerostris darwini]|uniref:Gag-pol polyprotein n=1 Tax=Caerostris darwini TaxID=1538125 RepID=A0AAV4M8Q8_9ARAC|nr:uncharacterized protein CDAR_515171 [Caerostris darwini]